MNPRHPMPDLKELLPAAGYVSGRLESKWVMLDGGPMHSIVSTERIPLDSPSIVVLSGFVVSASHSEPAAKLLAPFGRVYVPDPPGYGRSAKPRRVPDVRRLADYLASWMEILGIERAAIVGGSFGSQIVAELTVRYPQRVERAVLAGPTIDREARTLLKQVWRWLVNGTREPPLTRGMIHDYIRANPARVYKLARYAFQDRIEDKMPHINVPTLVMRGERDPIAPQRWVEYLVGLLPQGRLVVIPGAAHSLLHHVPQKFVRAVLPFILEQNGLDGHGGGQE